MFRNARRLLIPFVLGSFLIIAAIFWLSQSSHTWDILFFTETAPHKNYESLSKEGQEQIRKDIHAYNEAMNRENIELCQHIIDLIRREECHDHIVLRGLQTEHSPYTCEDILHAWRKQTCRDALAKESALSSLDKSQCASIENDRTRKQCREEVDGTTLQILLTEKRATPSACESLEPSFRSDCLRSIQSHHAEETYLEAIKSGNITRCQQITEPTLAATCRDTLLLEEAQNKHDPEICQKIHDHEKRQFCLDRTRVGKDIDILRDAIQTNQIEQCQKISDIRMRHQCHDTLILAIVRSSKNAHLCQTLHNTGIIEDCRRIQSP